MRNIATYTFNHSFRSEVMEEIKHQIDNPPDQWPSIHKALILLDFLLRNGSEYLIDDVKQWRRRLHFLSKFSHVDGEEDSSRVVRHRARKIIRFLNDPMEIIFERRKAKELQHKCTSYSSEEVIRSSRGRKGGPSSHRSHSSSPGYSLGYSDSSLDSFGGPPAAGRGNGRGAGLYYSQRNTSTHNESHSAAAGHHRGGGSQARSRTHQPTREGPSLRGTGRQQSDTFSAYSEDFESEWDMRSERDKGTEILMHPAASSSSRSHTNTRTPPAARHVYGRRRSISNTSFTPPPYLFEDEAHKHTSSSHSRADANHGHYGEGRTNPDTTRLDDSNSNYSYGPRQHAAAAHNKARAGANSRGSSGLRDAFEDESEYLLEMDAETEDASRCTQATNNPLFSSSPAATTTMNVHLHHTAANPHAQGRNGHAVPHHVSTRNGSTRLTPNETNTRPKLPTPVEQELLDSLPPPTTTTTTTTTTNKTTFRRPGLTVSTSDNTDTAHSQSQPIGVPQNNRASIDWDEMFSPIAVVETQSPEGSTSVTPVPVLGCSITPPPTSPLSPSNGNRLSFNLGQTQPGIVGANGPGASSSTGTHLKPTANLTPSGQLSASPPTGYSVMPRLSPLAVTAGNAAARSRSNSPGSKTPLTNASFGSQRSAFTTPRSSKSSDPSLSPPALNPNPLSSSPKDMTLLHPHTEAPSGTSPTTQTPIQIGGSKAPSLPFSALGVQHVTSDGEDSTSEEEEDPAQRWGQGFPAQKTTNSSTKPTQPKPQQATTTNPQQPLTTTSRFATPQQTAVSSTTKQHPLTSVTESGSSLLPLGDSFDPFGSDDIPTTSTSGLPASGFSSTLQTSVTKPPPARKTVTAQPKPSNTDFYTALVEDQFAGL
eukprot:TRINITY_DN43_c0_g1_i1.p1 TRINITY_DN43_c0_g1~~TRINITY_DN43_c0_g1_i1.p1  ORF type:complete len:926 (-),score=57.67 TRINITY_DN43_c0_g1_i1:77-2707(-)